MAVAFFTYDAREVLLTAVEQQLDTYTSNHPNNLQEGTHLKTCPSTTQQQQKRVGWGLQSWNLEQFYLSAI